MMLNGYAPHHGKIANRGHRRHLMDAHSVAPFPARTCSRRVHSSVASPRTTTSTEYLGDNTVIRDEDGRVVRLGPVTAELIRDHSSLFQSLLKEYAYWIEDSWVEGTIPPELCGTYYRNGPGLQIDNPRYKRHTFDGDGMVLSLAFKEGRAYFTNRFVRTEGFVKEQEAGRPLFRNSFTRGAADGSMLFNPFDLSFKNVANTGVLKWAGKLYAMWEGGLPYSLDPSSLETRGPSRLDGALKGKTFAAHYRVLPEQEGQQGAGRRWVSFSTDTGFGGASITFYEFAEDGRLLHETTEKLEGETLAFIHDMLVTEHYYVILLSPVDFEGRRFLTEYVFSRCSIAECLQFNPQKPTRVMLVPRPGRPSGKVLRTKVMPAPASFNFHHANAFELERPHQLQQHTATAPAPPPPPPAAAAGAEEPLVVIDTVAMDSVTFSVNQHTYGPDYFTGGPRSHLVRLICDPAAGSATPHRLLRRTLEFPSVDPRVVGRPHKHVWAGADMVDDDLHWGPFQGLIRADVDPRVGLPAAYGNEPAAAGIGGEDGPEYEEEVRQQTAAATPSGRFRGPYGTAAGVAADVWYAGERRFPGEPMFVPRPGSDREGDGWLVVAVHNAGTQKGEVVILDAMDLSAGPVATIYLPHRLPAGLHGSWDADFFNGPPADSSAPRWRELATFRAL